MLPVYRFLLRYILNESNILLVMALDFFAMILLGLVYAVVRWAVNHYRSLTNNNESGSSTFSLFCSAKVDWEWVEPIQVGETMTFKVKFFGLAGLPRSISDVKNLKIEIMKNSLTIAHVEELVQNEQPPQEGSDAPVSQNSNVIKVSFTVRASGVYTITIYEDGRLIAGSPHKKVFIPGPPVASRTTLIRTLNSSTVLPITQNLPHVLTIEPRDEFGNTCANRLHQYDLRDKLSLMVSEIGGDEEDFIIPVSTDLRLANDTIIVDLFVPISGCFHAVTTYENEIINNGEFDLVVLTEEEMEEVQENVERRNLNVWYEAKLLDTSHDQYSSPKENRSSLFSRTLSMGDIPGSSTSNNKPSLSAFRSRRILSSTSSLSKPKSVYCYITPKQIVVKEFYFKIFPKRLQSFRLCQATKITVLSPANKSLSPVIMINDNCQPAYTLSCPLAYILIATFIGILNKNIGGSDSYEEKVKYFRQELSSYHKISRFSRGQVYLTVKREQLLYDSYKTTKHLSVKDWLKQFQINFEGELGVDWGGLSREWVTQLCKILFIPDQSLDESSSGDSKIDGADMFKRLKDDNQALVLPNSNATSGSKLKFFEFAGKLVGKCLIDSCFEREQIKYVTARFARSFLAQIIGLAVTFKHFESDDPELYKSKIRYIIENDVSDFDLYFSEEEYHSNGKLSQVVPLKPNGAKLQVTNENKLEYLNRLAQYRLSTSIKDEIDAFNKGLNFLVPDHLLSMFDENELELLMCGSSKIDVQDMKKYCNVENRSPAFVRTLQWFWVVVSSFTQDELAMLLQFITGCSQLPPGGFADLSPRLKISFLFYQSNILPTAHTCFNELCLPLYDSYDKLHKMLNIAIKEGAVGFGMI
ncbi:apoptosis-resistant E3 ubiquitin protein ligase 1-like [Styela clava]